jgi:hypothetical protein
MIRRARVGPGDRAANPADQTLVRLSCLDDDAQGQELEALWEKEVDARPWAPAGIDHH